MTLRIAARHADEWNISRTGPDLPRKMAILDGYCKEMGRDPRSIGRSLAYAMAYTDDPADAEKALRAMARRRGIALEQAQSSMFYGSADMIEQQVRGYITMGFTHFILQVAHPRHIQDLARFAREVMPRFKSALPKAEGRQSAGHSSPP